MAVHVGERGPGHLARSGAFYPGASVALDFLSQRYRVGTGSGFTSAFASMSGVSVSRNSVGYAQNADGTLSLFQANQPRIGNGMGLLVEEARTNNLKYSQDLTNAAYNKTNLAVAANVIQAPDGTLTGNSLTSTLSGSGARAMSQTYTNPTGDVAFSVFAKAGTLHYVNLVLAQTTPAYAAAVFDLTTGVATQTSTGGGATLISTSSVALANGWWRLTIVATNPTASASLYNVTELTNAGTGNTFSSSGDISYTGTTSDSIYVWGEQAEFNAFSSSYIPTTSATATRAADLVKFTGLSIPNAAVTMVASGTPSTATGIIQALASFNDATLNNQLIVYRDTTGNAHAQVAVSSTAIYDQSGGAWAANANLTVGVSAIIGAQLGAVGGTALTAGTSASQFTGVNQLNLGNRALNDLAFDGYVRRVLLYPRAMPQSELNTATSQ